MRLLSPIWSSASRSRRPLFGVAFLLLLLAAPSSHAGLGESREAVEKKLGAAKEIPPGPPATLRLEFRSAARVVKADFIGDRCERVIVEMAEGSIDTETRDAILKEFAPGGDWFEQDAARLEREDGKAFATVTPAMVEMHSTKWAENEPPPPQPLPAAPAA